jgi:hypothetical protein
MQSGLQFNTNLIVCKYIKKYNLIGLKDNLLYHFLGNPGYGLHFGTEDPGYGLHPGGCNWVIIGSYLDTISFAIPLCLV